MSYYDKIINLSAGINWRNDYDSKTYLEGHSHARHHAAEIAAEADARIAELEARLAELCGKWPEVEALIETAEAEAAHLRAALEAVEKKHEAATKMIAQIKPALEIYAKEENWYLALESATHREWFTIYDDGRCMNGWEIAETALACQRQLALSAT